VPNLFGEWRDGISPAPARWITWLTIPLSCGA
jgi:hypothetical protein